MRINKTSRRKGVHKLSIPKAHKPSLIKTPKFPTLKSLKKLPKLKKY